MQFGGCSRIRLESCGLGLAWRDLPVSFTAIATLTAFTTIAVAATPFTRLLLFALLTLTGLCALIRGGCLTLGIRPG